MRFSRRTLSWSAALCVTAVLGIAPAYADRADARAPRVAAVPVDNLGDEVGPGRPGEIGPRDPDVPRRTTGFCGSRSWSV